MKKNDKTGDLQIRPKPGQRLRVALLSEFCQPKASAYHWYRNDFYRGISKNGVEAECCRVAQRSWTCVCLALLYLNADSKGKLSRGAEVKYRIGYVSLARSAYEQVSEFESTAPGCDLYYSRGDNYHFAGASATPRWKESPQSSAIIAEATTWTDGSKLIEKLGKKLTEAEWQRLITKGTLSTLADYQDEE